MFPYFSIDPRLQELSRQAEEEIRPQFEKIEEVQRYNQQKMLAAFNRAGVSESHFAASTGYGYGDRGGLLRPRSIRSSQLIPIFEG